MSNFFDRLHRASWRGVPFGVDLESERVGRRKVQHDYPGRDTSWFEDQGLRPGEFRITGFLITDSAVYGGGDVRGQRARMVAAANAEGQGTLVHPSKGRITVDCLDLVVASRWDEGEYYELQFSFAQGGPRKYPGVLSDLSGIISTVTGLADIAGVGDFVAKVAGPLQHGLDAASAIASTAEEWIGKVGDLTRDATGLYGTLSQLGGADFGRYFNGRNTGFLAGLTSPYASAASVSDLIALGSSQRQKVATAAGVMREAIGTLGVGSDGADVATAAQGVVSALAGSVADPQDGVRILSDLAAFAPVGTIASAPAGIATSDLFQRAAASALARVASSYAPASADDAHAVRVQVLAPVQAAIDRAGLTGADDVFQTFRSVRKAVTDDLGRRGGSLARLAEVVTARPLPSVILAQRRYADANREGELVTQADPIHPWFMPTSFRALSA